MPILEPHSTRYDLNFSIAGIPVRIHPTFWAVAVLLGIMGARGIADIVLWAVALFVSILVHELGHAVAARSYGWPPRILLYSMGGIAAYEPRKQSQLSRVVIAFAGPAAGFALGALVLGSAVAAGYAVQLLPGLPWTIGEGPSLWMAGSRLELFAVYLLYVNIFWGLVNLLPVQPLDGGTIAAAIIEKYRPRDALLVSLKFSLATAIVMAILGAVFLKSIFVAMMFALLAYSSWSNLNEIR